ncbi:MAG: polysaccharide pyruvyl transferase family protein [Sedimentisphaerales bacterium]|nr:polysaccharide pyruvyl transferase family protein [Sedimentisphaerales bacterium]
MELAILGAFDRYNYGDLLFPLILHKFLPGTNIMHYGLSEADFTEIGSVQAKPFSEFFNKYKNSNSKNVIIVAGGSVVGTRAAILYSFLKHTPILNLCRYISKILHLPNPADKIAQKKLNITWGNYPFFPVKPNNKTLLIYNAVGDNFKGNLQEIDGLKDADYLSVRNKSLFDRLKCFLDKEKLALSPDSASVISSLWPKKSLKNLMTPEAKSILTDFKDGYIIFQAKAKTKWHFRAIRKQLNRLYHETKLPIVLLSIGRACRHEDHILSERLSQKLSVPSRTANVMGLHDIMGLIAHSSMFIGTSLHGNITAMSYAVPHIGITPIRKLDHYLKHWDIEPVKTMGSVKVSHLCDAALTVLQNTDRNELQKNAERLNLLSSENLKKISQLVQDYLNCSY